MRAEDWLEKHVNETVKELKAEGKITHSPIPPQRRFGAAAKPSDHDSTLFIRNAERFIQRLRRAKQVRIAVNLYQAGEPIFIFDVTGFEPARVGLPRATPSRSVQ